MHADPQARLYEIELEKRAEALDEIRGPKTTIGFGNQIRSYVLYPYQMVKDLRTGVETSNIEAVLDDGDLDPFVIGYHRWATGNAMYKARRSKTSGGFKPMLSPTVGRVCIRNKPCAGWFLSGESVESNTRRSSKRIRWGALF